MKIIDINKKTNEAIVDYNGTDILRATITGMYFVKEKLHIEVKLPDWCCNGAHDLIDVSDKFELNVKE